MTMQRPATWTNWAGTATARLAGLASPRTVAELQAAVTAATGRVKPVGAGHSFTPIAQTDGVQLRLDGLAGILRADRETGLVTVLAGTRLGELSEALWHLGLSMTNLGEIDDASISGAIATGTHGTGASFGGIATQVRALQLVLADGSLLECGPSRDPDVFAAACVGLGALGVIATVTLQCEPAFALAAAAAPGELEDVLAELDLLVDGNDHFEFSWFPHTRRALTKRHNRVLPDTALQPLSRLRSYLDDEFLANTVFDALNRLTARRPGLIPRANGIAARALGARDYIDRSYRVFAAPRRVVFREMEYAVPRAAVPHLLSEIRTWLASSGETVAFPVQVRFAAADGLWLSTANGRATGYVAVRQYVRREYRRYFRAVEAIARELDGRPHWGKLHFRDADSLRAGYPHFEQFLAVRDRLDPQRRFGNDYLRQVLGS